MKRYYFTFVTIFIIVLSSLSFADEFKNIKDGDIIFQISQSTQSNAIKLATHSKYTHIGIIFFKDKKPFVLEAVQPVRYTKLSDWIKKGKNNHYVIKRLNKNILSRKQIKKMKSIGDNFLNHDYDILFNWSDKELYCSELVWKLYKRGADIKLCELKKLKDFDLTHPTVKILMRNRYTNAPPLNEKVVSPKDIFDSEFLTDVTNQP